MTDNLIIPSNEPSDEPRVDPLRAPFTYFGGKRTIAHEVWKRLGNPGHYIEPFFGSGAVLLNRPSQPGLETVNDADGLLSNFWRSIQKDPEAVADHADWPVSELDLHARHSYLVDPGRRMVEPLRSDPDFYDAKLAGWWVWGISQWIGGGWCEKMHRRLPNVGNTGRGVHRFRQNLTQGSGEDRGGCLDDAVTTDGPYHQIPNISSTGAESSRIPHISGSGTGVHKITLNGSLQRPHLTGLGMGIHRCPSRDQLISWFGELSHRLRHVRICCGDFKRVLGPSTVAARGVCGVFLDPPYSQGIRSSVYAVETDCAAESRQWAIDHGDDPKIRIALCGYDLEHDDHIPSNWERFRWKAAGGYGNQGTGRGKKNASREVIWFSPHCIPVTRIPTLFDSLDLFSAAVESGQEDAA